MSMIILSNRPEITSRTSVIAPPKCSGVARKVFFLTKQSPNNLYTLAARRLPHRQERAVRNDNKEVIFDNYLYLRQGGIIIEKFICDEI